MGAKIARTKIRREPGFLYFLDADGDVSRVRMRPGARPGRPRKVARLGIAIEPEFLYFIDIEGDVARARKARAQLA